MPLRQEKLEAEFLVKAMSEIRDRSTREVAMMHHEAERMFDWREYVRFKPLFAVAASAFIGFAVVKRLSRRKSMPVRTSHSPIGHDVHHPSSSENGNADRSNSKAGKVRDLPSEDAVERATTRASITSGITAFIGSLASSAIKVYLQRYIREQLGGNRRDFTEEVSRDRSFERDKVHYN